VIIDRTIEKRARRIGKILTDGYSLNTDDEEWDEKFEEFFEMTDRELTREEIEYGLKMCSSDDGSPK
jgi:hypothetical protein